MAGMMLHKDDINFADTKDFQEPTDHVVVHIWAHVLTQNFYKWIQYKKSDPMPILGTESLKSVPWIRPWNRNKLQVLPIFEFHREEKVLLMEQILKICSKTGSVDASLSAQDVYRAKENKRAK